MPDEEPLFRVVRGTPTAEEIAALVGVILVRSRPSAPVPRPLAAGWTRQSRPGAVSPSGLPTRPGADAWRRSGLPR